MTKEVSKSELANKVYIEMSTLPKTKIVSLFKGKHAIDRIKLLFFPDNDKKATTWAKRWTPAEKSQAIFIIYERTKKVNTIIGYQFVIGNLKTGSSLGSYWNDYNEGITELKRLDII